MDVENPKIFAGLSQVTYDGEQFDFGYGVTLRSTYAHLFAAPVMAFARAAEGKHHPPPWRAARGGFDYDVEVELAVPIQADLPAGLTADETVRLIASLLRLARYAYLIVPVISDHPFDAAATAKEEPVLRCLEIEQRIVSAGAAELAKMRRQDLEWVRSVWPATAALLKKDRKLAAGLWAVDACTVTGRAASSLLVAWGALEELFAPGSRGEIRYRVSANIAAFLKPIGPERLALFNEIRELYDARSAVAHTAKDADIGDLLRTFVILRNALVKILGNGGVPTAQELQNALFVGEK